MLCLKGTEEMLHHDHNGRAVLAVRLYHVDKWLKLKLTFENEKLYYALQVIYSSDILIGRDRSQDRVHFSITTLKVLLFSLLATAEVDIYLVITLEVQFCCFQKFLLLLLTLHWLVLYPESQSSRRMPFLCWQWNKPGLTRASLLRLNIQLKYTAFFVPWAVRSCPPCNTAYTAWQCVVVSLSLWRWARQHMASPGPGGG